MSENDRKPAESLAETLHRHRDPDPEQWDEAEAVTGRPNDLKQNEVENSTFAERAKRHAREKKVDSESTDNKAVTGASTKKAAKGRSKA